MADEFPHESYIQFGLPDVPFSAVRIPMTENPQPYIDRAVIFRELYLKAFQGPPVSGSPEPRVQTPVAPQQAPQRPQGQGRADRYPLLEGWACDRCGGPAGRRPQTGRMTSDSAVCLGTCSDGKFVHHIGWLD